jgi:hypothetical protein
LKIHGAVWSSEDALSVTQDIDASTISSLYLSWRIDPADSQELLDIPLHLNQDRQALLLSRRKRHGFIDKSGCSFVS